MADLAPLIFNPNNPLPIARSFIEDGFKKDGAQTLYHHAGQFFQWNGACYLPTDQATIH